MRRIGRATIPLTAIVGVLALAASFHAMEAAPSRDPGEVVRRVQAWIDGTRTLRCKFVQSLRSGALGEGVTESGRLQIARPGRVRWDYEGREAKVAIYDNGATLLYLPDDHEMVRGSISDETSWLPDLLSGRARIDALFDASLDGGSSSDEVRLKLSAKRSGAAIDTLVLLLAPDSYEVRGAEVRDAAGNASSYRFSSMRRNVALDAQTWRFQPPPGTRIVDPS